MSGCGLPGSEDSCGTNRVVMKKGCDSSSTILTLPSSSSPATLRSPWNSRSR